MKGLAAQFDLYQATDAREFVEKNLVDQPARLKHVIAVASNVAESAQAIAKRHPNLKIDPSLAYCAALLHDIGYAPCARRTGFHPVDGCVFLTELGYKGMADLILGHSAAPEEAEILGLAPIAVSSALEARFISYWDMQVKQGGQVISYAERLADIVSRYGEESPIGRANLKAQPRIELIIDEVRNLLTR